MRKSSLENFALWAHSAGQFARLYLFTQQEKFLAEAVADLKRAAALVGFDLVERDHA